MQTTLTTTIYKAFELQRRTENVKKYKRKKIKKIKTTTQIVIAIANANKIRTTTKLRGLSLCSPVQIY